MKENWKKDMHQYNLVNMKHQHLNDGLTSFAISLKLSLVQYIAIPSFKD